MNGFTLLTKEECFGKDKLEIFKKRGNKAVITDFSVLLGGKFSTTYMFKKGKKISFDKEKLPFASTGYYWTKTATSSGNVYIVNNDGKETFVDIHNRDGSARVAMKYSNLNSLLVNRDSKIERSDDGILEIEYGYYPQDLAIHNEQKILNDLYKKGALPTSLSTYTTDSFFYGGVYDIDGETIFDTKFTPKIYKEYLYHNKKYIRMKVKLGFEKDDYKFSNGESYLEGSTVWVEVQPVKWLVDEKNHLIVSDKLLFAGIQFSLYKKYFDDDFNKTEIKYFLDGYFSKDLVDKRNFEMLGQLLKKNKNDMEFGDIFIEEEEKSLNKRKSRIERLNPDNEIQNKVKMTDTEIIKNWIDAGESVLLRGPSGIGKTERIKELYPNLIYIKLTNNMFPEKIVGSINLQTGQSIPPDFAKTVIMQEATEDEKKIVENNIQRIFDISDRIYERSKNSDKKVVIMLDELLNVKPAVQSLVYTLVLNRMIEIGKGLKLPDNVVVVATGNQKRYSQVAEDLAEPLEKRFDHILDMEPKVGEWITEYAIPKKIHPAVIGYILSKYNSTGKSESLKNIEYFYEEPEVGERNLDENGNRGRTNDPRGWVCISNTLYNFERNLKNGRYKGKDVEDIVKRTIESKLRIEWASDFFDFYNLPTLTPEEVVKGLGKGYTKGDLPRDTSERFAYMTSLINANEEEVESCREFIRKYCDPEYLSIYDIYWAGQDERRMEKISELENIKIEVDTKKDSKEYVNEGVKAYKKIGKMYDDFFKNKDLENKENDDLDDFEV